MKVMVSTNETQGQRKNDYCWVPEGELLAFIGFECDGEAVDGRCGCRRGFSGLASSKATTTAKVVDLPMNYADVAKAVRDNLQSGGWLDLGDPAENDEWIEELTKDAIAAASAFPVGTIIERRGDTLQNRADSLDAYAPAGL